MKITITPHLQHIYCNPNVSYSPRTDFLSFFPQTIRELQKLHSVKQTSTQRKRAVLLYHKRCLHSFPLMNRIVKMQ